MFKLMAMDPRLTRTSLLAENPMVWMVMLDNGMIDDARRYPRSVQQEPVDSGILPFVHPEAVDDLGEEGEDEEDDRHGVASSNGNRQRDTGFQPVLKTWESENSSSAVFHSQRTRHGLKARVTGYGAQFTAAPPR